MGKRWIWIGFLTISLLGAILLLQPPKDDGLGFIRSHGPHQEFLSHLGDFKRGPGGRPIPITVWDRVFVFDKVPERLLLDIRSKGKLIVSTQAISPLKDIYLFPISKDRVGLYYSTRNMIVVTGEPPPNWLTRQWNALRRQMGADFTTPRSSK